jgi:hypothetical protein
MAPIPSVNTERVTERCIRLHREECLGKFIQSMFCDLFAFFFFAALSRLSNGTLT